MDLNTQCEAVKTSAVSARSTGDNQAFFYIDGIPTKGLWVDVDEVGAWEDVQLLLSRAFPSAVIDEILCADVEGLAVHFYASNCDSFDMDRWVEFLEEKESTHLDDDVIDAYFGNCGVCPLSDVEEAYQGEFNSDEDFAWDLLESCGDLPTDSLLANYFDIEKYARDLMFDYFENDGHYFRNL